MVYVLRTSRQLCLQTLHFCFLCYFKLRIVSLTLIQILMESLQSQDLVRHTFRLRKINFMPSNGVSCTTPYIIHLLYINVHTSTCIHTHFSSYQHLNRNTRLLTNAHTYIHLFITSAMTRNNGRHHRHCRACSRCRGSAALIDCHTAPRMREFKNYRLYFLMSRRHLQTPLATACVHIFLIVRASASRLLALTSGSRAPLMVQSAETFHFILPLFFGHFATLHSVRLLVYIYIQIYL